MYRRHIYFQNKIGKIKFSVKKCDAVLGLKRFLKLQAPALTINLQLVNAAPEAVFAPNSARA